VTGFYGFNSVVYENVGVGDYKLWVVLYVQHFVIVQEVY
jgi:hypothetical protein